MSEVNFRCVVCLDDLPECFLAHLPCCHRPSALTQCCVPCIRAVCSRGTALARCPCCRSFISIEDDPSTVIHKVTRAGQCHCCRQHRVLTTDLLCDACALGRQIAVTYECQRCHGLQRIPHPMWRYQRTPAEYGTTSWACHRCGDYTYWRVSEQDVGRVPLGDCPVSWGRQELWYHQIREARAHVCGVMCAVRWFRYWILCLFVLLVSVFWLYDEDDWTLLRNSAFTFYHTTFDWD